MSDPIRIDLEQRTPEWHEWRKCLGMASEAAAMLGISPFWPRTPEQLYAAKRLDRQAYETPAMRRGVELESVAIEAAENEIDMSFSPACYQRGHLGASLDGIDFTGRVILEVKVPAKGSESPLYLSASRGEKLPDHYMAQVQQQLFCSGADACMFAVYAHDTVGLEFVAVVPDAAWRQRIVDGWADWLAKADSGAFSAATAERTDAEWIEAARQYRYAKLQAALFEAEAEAARARLAALSGGKSCEGGGLKYTVSDRKGSIDYKAIVNIFAPSANLEGFRKAGTSAERITLEDDQND